MKIIKSYDLKVLKTSILCDIDEARNQAKLYADEAEQQEHSKRDQSIIEKTRASQKFWNLRGDVLHEYLVRIEKHTSEIEI